MKNLQIYKYEKFEDFKPLNEGASSYVIDLDGDKDTVRALVLQRIQDDREDYGERYGNLSSFSGVKFATRVIEDDDEVVDFIETKSEKWVI